MKTISKLVLLAGVTVLGITACKRVDDSPLTPRYGSLSEVRALMQRSSSTAVVDAATGGSYQLGRCRVTVPANAFQTLGGGTVSGSVTLRFLDLLKRGDMIYARVLPVSNGAPLVSGGEVQLLADQNGTALRLRPGALIQVRIPQDGRDATGMTLFAGDLIESVQDGANIVNWRQRRDQSGAGVVVNGDTVVLTSDSVGWCNADRFLPAPNYQTFTVTIQGPGAFQPGEVTGYASYDNFLGAWPLSSRSGNVYAESHVPDIPVHFVIYGIRDGRFYGGISAATPATGSNYNVTLTEMSVAEFKAMVDAL